MSNRFKKSGTMILSLLAAFLLLFAAACDKTPVVPVIPDDDAPPVPTRTVTQSKLVTYEGPQLLDSSGAVSVNVENEEQFVYETRVNHSRLFGWVAPSTTNPVVLFDFEGKVNVEVNVTGAAELHNVKVRPLSYGITPVVSGGKITFTLEYPASYTVEYGKTAAETASTNALHIFANPLEENPVTADNIPANTVYIGPGVWEAGAIPLTAGQTLYVAGGAYVFGQVRAELVDNLTIRGRGIFSASIYQRNKANEYYLPMEFKSCKNLKIEGVTMLDPAGWAVTLYKCTDVVMDNVKMITARANGDGISVQSCKNVLVKGGFVRSWDDSLVVKNTDRGATDNVVFDGVTVWTDLAQSCEVGFEANGATMNNIVFRNITILHAMHKAAISLHNADDAAVTGVKYERITIEDAQNLGDNRLDLQDDYLIDFQILYSPEWSKAPNRGPVSNILVNNIKVLEMADSVVCRISGESAQVMIKDVIINNVSVEGVLMNTAQQLKLTTTYASNVTVTSGGADITGARTAYPYLLQLAGSAVSKTKVNTKPQAGLEVPAFALREIPETYMGQKIAMTDTAIAVTHGKGALNSSPYDDGTGDYSAAANPAANLIDGSRNTFWKNKGWTEEADEFIAITFDFKRDIMPGVVRVYLAEDNPYVYSFNISLFNKRSETATNFAVANSLLTYLSSPSGGNYFDIKLSSTLVSRQLQLRIFRTDGMSAMRELKINEIAFFPSSLSTNKTVTADSTSDVYSPTNLADGNTSSYWEGLHENSWCAVDLGAVYNILYINLHLPPSMAWEPRTQVIEVLISADGVNFTQLIAPKSYDFNPMTGNFNSIVLDSAASARYVKFQWSSNTSLGGYGAQLSEVYIYGE